MKVLHLISNHKLTGPVDPAIGLARALADLSVDSRCAVGRPRPGEGPIDDLVRERGLEPIADLRLSKHRRFLSNRSDARVLANMLRADPADILHCHLDNAHGIARRARRLALLGPRRPLVVRSFYDAEAPRPTAWSRRIFGATDGFFVFGELPARGLVEGFGLPPERVVKLQGAVDSVRFRPRSDSGEIRKRFEIPPDALVVGIVARIQRHRRFEVLLEAVREVMRKLPDVHLMILGRGTHAREIAHEAARRLGIQEKVRLPGYVGGDGYAAALSCFDLKVFLVPGTDGTCRAVREAMATGVPVIAARRGLLPEIVRDGIDGFIVDDGVEPLAHAIWKLASDAGLRRKLGESALGRAREDFSQRKQAEEVLEAYRRWMDALT